MRRQRHHSHRRMVVVNIVFVLSVLMFLGGVTSLVFALGWFRLGPQMEDKKQWIHSTCTIADSQLGASFNPYSSDHRWRAEFKVSFPLTQRSGNGTTEFIGAVATVTLDRSWVSHVQALQDQADYPVGNKTACFCPLIDTNLYDQPSQWSIYRFCLFKFTQAELDNLVFYYHCWLYSGIVFISLMLPLMLGIIYFWVGTRCYRRPFRWCPSRRGRGKYDILN